MACDPNDTLSTDTKPSWMSTFVRWTCFCKYSTLEMMGNIFGALTDIASAIREYSEAQSQRGYAVGLLHFRVEGGTAVTNGQLINEILARSAFNNKIVGFGASIVTYPNSAGASATDDTISVRLYDFTAGAFVSDALVLTQAQKHGNHTDDGNSIGDNITPGHEFGVKITYGNSDAGAFTMPDVDIFIYSEPNELTYAS